MFQRYILSTTLLVRNVECFHCVRWESKWIRFRNKGLRFIHQTVSNAGAVEIKRTVPLTADEHKSLRSSKPSQPENPHLLKVSILGEPNVGKSTLINSLVKWKVCAVSRKVHTTRKQARAVLVEGNTQIVFLDTPGFVTPENTKRHSLEASFVMDPLNSIREADLIAVVVDIADTWRNSRINPEILRVLYDFKDKKSILIMNKVDAMKSKGRLLRFTQILTNSEKEVKKEEMSATSIASEVNEHLGDIKDVDSSFYESIEQKRGWPLFSKVFMVSALTNDGVDELRNHLLSEAVPRNWLFHEGVVTDQSAHDIALTIVKQTLLEHLPNEIPYKLDMKITKWEMLSTGCPSINIQIKCANSRIRKIVIGPKGRYISTFVEQSKKAMRESFRRDVVLKLAVV